MPNPNFLVSYRELRVYQAAVENALQVFELTQQIFTEISDTASSLETSNPPTTHPSLQHLTTVLIQSSRLVCVHISQAWLRRRYPTAFIARLNHAEAEAAAVQVWLELAVLCHHLDPQVGQELHHQYQQILTELDRLITHSVAWTTPV